MATGPATTDSAGTPSHIIERPRLLKRLDQAEARVVLLLAPAGYGKTTLARQWLESRKQPHAWLRATKALEDVAALGVEMVRAVRVVLPEAGKSFERRLFASSAPNEEPELLAEILAEDLVDWPYGSWIVLDDYHLISGSEASEAFIDILWSLTPIRLLIASRHRPAWATTRRVLYGDVIELSQSALTMTTSEAVDVLRRPADVVRPLLEHAQGWPVVIALAAFKGDLEFPDQQLSPSLVEYFAEELYRDVSERLKRFLMEAAVIPNLTPASVRGALDADGDTIEAGVRSGFLAAGREGGWEIHPLLRDFLRHKLLNDGAASAVAARIANSLINDGSWDDAFEIISEFRLTVLLDRLVRRALGNTLSTSRFATATEWLRLAERIGHSSPVILTAEAELARRAGRYEEGEALGAQAAKGLSGNDELRAVALSAAGECAHLRQRFRHALEYQSAAETAAKDRHAVQRAVWGQFIASAELETDDLAQRLKRFEELDDQSVDFALRRATGIITASSRGGALDRAAREARELLHLLRHAKDPLVATSFVYRLAWAQLTCGAYADALATVQRTHDEARRSRLGWVSRLASVVEAAAHLGIRNFSRAQLLLDAAERGVTSSYDGYVAANVRAIRMRYYLARGHLQQAREASEFDDESIGVAGLRGECLALRGIVQTIAGDYDAADACFKRSLILTREVEARCLTLTGLAIKNLSTASIATSAMEQATSEIAASGNFDSLVTCYRAYPPLLKAFSDRQRQALDLQAVIIRARDIRLGERYGILKRRSHMPSSDLSTREREVLLLLCEGLTNKEIATRLVISLATAKVHVSNILAKLDVRTRTEAVARAHALDIATSGRGSDSET